MRGDRRRRRLGVSRGQRREDRLVFGGDIQQRP
jgi:hypothetical protein